MQDDSKKITGILLSGGKSKRMGHEKGMIRIANKQMYKYPLEVLESLCDEILISSNQKDFIKEEYEQVYDEIPGIGPMGGLFTCLKKSSNEINIVLSYDLPLVRKELFEELLTYIDLFDIVLPEMKAGKLEPLCGIYKKSVFATFEKLIKAGNYSVHKAVPEVKSKTILIDKNMSFYDPNLFLNINRESDLDSLPQELF
jgi:molybdopterin-guanine dinucleotide biosynthesis protein A